MIKLFSILDEGGKSLPGSGPALIKWRPSLSLINVLTAVKYLLVEPNPNSPANLDASKMFLRLADPYCADV